MFPEMIAEEQSAVVEAIVEFYASAAPRESGAIRNPAID
jgi:hypothetical protein